MGLSEDNVSRVRLMKFKRMSSTPELDKVVDADTGSMTLDDEQLSETQCMEKKDTAEAVTPKNNLLCTNANEIRGHCSDTAKISSIQWPKHSPTNCSILESSSISRVVNSDSTCEGSIGSGLYNENKCFMCQKGMNVSGRRKSWCTELPLKRQSLVFRDTKRNSGEYWDNQTRCQTIDSAGGKSSCHFHPNTWPYSSVRLVNHLDQRLKQLCNIGKATTLAHPSEKRRLSRPSIFDSGRLKTRRSSDNGIPLTLSDLKAKRKNEVGTVFDLLRASNLRRNSVPLMKFQGSSNTLENAKAKIESLNSDGSSSQEGKRVPQTLITNSRNIFDCVDSIPIFGTQQEQVEKSLDLLREENHSAAVSGEDLFSKSCQDTAAGGEEEASQDLTKVLSRHLASFADKLHLTKDRLEDTAKCYLLLDKAYEWALEAMKVVDQVKSSGVVSPEQVGIAAKAIGNYLQENPPVSEDAFAAMLTLATRLNNQTLLQQCKVAQSRCQETTNLLKCRHSTLLKARRQMEFDCQSYVDLNDVLSGPDDQSPFIWLSNSTLNSSGRRKSGSSVGSRPRDPLSRCSSLETEDDVVFPEPQSSSTPVKQALEARASLGDIKELRESAEDLQVPYSTDSKRPVAFNPSSPQSIYASSILAFSSGSSSCSSSDSSGSITGKANSNTSRSWRFSEISAQSAEDNQAILDDSLLSSLSPFRSKPSPPSSTNSHLLIRGSQINLSNSEDLTQEEVKKSKTLLLIMQELIQTERDYVNSLEYIIENYIPELMREDIPQALRGQRNAIFGNLEKIYEFHSGYFLLALEACQSRPFSVGSIFLKYESQFYLYALYNKNKPKSDGLMSEYGSSFFKNKQIEVGDKMDLSSYLLKPVQRMGKYALLLKQLFKDCARSEEGYDELQSAQEMVQFQLRHGNDLLAMDSLRDCDVNLKEQGRLLRQAEFFVAEGSRKKSFRHVFLFEDLILFSKSRKDPEKKTLDIFQYKHSIKMTDIGLTEQMGESSNKFEIWFRKRKPSDTYILHTNNLEAKEAWTEEISKLLWRQALRNRTHRLHEMSSMGIGNKPCLDIRPSEDQINDRSVYIGRGPPRLRPNLTQPTESLMNSQRPHSVISISSSSSSAGSCSQSSSTGPTFTGNLNLGFEPGDSPRSLTRSVTRTSQCSAESGILPDMYPEKESDETHYKVERSNSSVTTISVDSGLSPCSPPSTSQSSSSLSPPPIPTSSTTASEATTLVIPVSTEDCKEEETIQTKSVLTTEV